jgi:hypothetical protein
MERLGIIPNGLDRPLAFSIHIAELSTGLIAIHRNEREPIGKPFSKGNARRKFRAAPDLSMNIQCPSN